MESLKFWAFFWVLCLVLCHIQLGSSLFLSYGKKKALKHIVHSKLAKLHAALAADHDYDDFDHYHHYHYKAAPVLVVPHHGSYHKYEHDVGHYFDDSWHGRLSHNSYHSWGGHHGWDK